MNHNICGGVRVFVIDKDRKILMVKHRYEEQGKLEEFWVVPGGGVEFGEYSTDAGIREVKEETGLDIKINRLLWTVEETTQHGIGLTNYFLGEIVGGELSLGFDPEFDNNQVLSDVKFFTKDEIKSVPRAYPEVLRHEFWEVIDQGLFNHQVWRKRPSKGFGVE